MATRATIKIEGVDYAKIYKHWDGGKKSTLPWLKKFNKEFTEARGDDPVYKFAQLLRSSERDAKEFGLDDSKHTGWGVVGIDHDMGEEYEYTLKTNGKTTCKTI